MRNLLKHITRDWRIGWLTLAIALVWLPSGFSAPTVLVSTGAVWRYFDGGMQPGSDWMSPGFDDTTWNSGAAELGFGDGDEATVINDVRTAYFRGTFTVANPADVSSLFLDLWRDDGAIVYINGVEVLRENMPPFPPTYFTLALGPAIDDGEEPVRANISPTVLVAGVNTIAVEMHQNSFTSTDMSFDLMLMADLPDPNRPPTANNQSVVAVQNSATPITLTGSDPDGNPLTYIITSLPAHGTLSGTPPNVTYTPALNYVGPDSFTFKVNDGALDSADATVSIQVVAPPDPPEIVSAVADCDGTQVVVTFNEPVDAAGATDVLNYAIADLEGNFAVPVSAALGADQQTVTITLDPRFPLIAGRSYLLTAVAICDLVGDCLRLQRMSVQFDGRPPTLACDIVVDNLWPPNHDLVEIGLSAISSEPNLHVQVFSDEPESGRGDAVLANGVLQLRSQREGKSDGRVYLIVVTAADPCGNVAVCCTTVVAPHDSSQRAFDSVTAQAAAAQAQCSPSGAPATPYQILP